MQGKEAEIPKRVTVDIRKKPGRMEEEIAKEIGEGTVI